MFSTNEIELIEAGDLQVIYESGAGLYRKLGGTTTLIGGHTRARGTAATPVYMLKKAFKYSLNSSAFSESKVTASPVLLISATMPLLLGIF